MSRITQMAFYWAVLEGDAQTGVKAISLTFAQVQDPDQVLCSP